MTTDRMDVLALDGQRYHCRLCLDVGRVRRPLGLEDSGFGKAKLCECLNGRNFGPQWQLQDFLRRARIPDRYQGCTIQTWAPYEGPPQRVAEWASEWPLIRPTLLLHGAVGNGKTHLAVGALRALAEWHGIVGRFYGAVELLDRIKNSFREESFEKTDDIENELERVPAILIDDLGTERPTDWAMERFFTIIDRRYKANHPLIITANCTLMELQQKMPRLASRLIDVNSSLVLQFQYKDHRSRSTQ